MRVTLPITLGATLLMAAGAHATSFFSLGGLVGASPGDPGLAPFETLAVTFDRPDAAFVTETDNAPHASIVYTQSILDVAAAPAGDHTTFEALGAGDTATFTFGAQAASIRSISVYVGSVDSYNTIDILGAGGHVDATITGSQIAQANWGDQGNWVTNRRVYISQLPSDFTGIEFASAGIAFEYDDIAVSAHAFTTPFGATYMTMPSSSLALAPIIAAPEPGTWGVCLVGFGVAGAALRSSRRRAARFA